MFIIFCCSVISLVVVGLLDVACFLLPAVVDECSDHLGPRAPRVGVPEHQIIGPRTGGAASAVYLDALAGLQHKVPEGVLAGPLSLAVYHPADLPAVQVQILPDPSTRVVLQHHKLALRVRLCDGHGPVGGALVGSLGRHFPSHHAHGKLGGLA